MEPFHSSQQIIINNNRSAPPILKPVSGNAYVESRTKHIKWFNTDNKAVLPMKLAERNVKTRLKVECVIAMYSMCSSRLYLALYECNVFVVYLTEVF